METTIVYWGSLGIMDKNMETTIVCLVLFLDNEKENGNYNSILVLFGDNGKGNGRLLYSRVI